jgi:hypothetical protein
MEWAQILGDEAPAANGQTSLAAVPTPSAKAQAAGKALSPENPLFWFTAVAAVTFGLMAFSTSVRVGHTTASVNLGSTS